MRRAIAFGLRPKGSAHVEISLNGTFIEDALIIVRV